MTWVTVTTVIVLAAALGAGADEAPPLARIVDDCLKATTQRARYHVDVVQTIFRGKVAVGDTVKEVAQDTCAFTLSCDPVTGTTTTKQEPAEGQGGATSRPRLNVRMAIDVGRFLREMRAWPEVAVAADELAGRPCYKVSGLSAKDNPNAMACTLWVDVEHSYVSKLLLDVQARRFAEASFEYRKVGDAPWQLSKATVVHPQDGSRIEQEFGAYQFEGK